MPLPQSLQAPAATGTVRPPPSRSGLSPRGTENTGRERPAPYLAPIGHRERSLETLLSPIGEGPASMAEGGQRRHCGRCSPLRADCDLGPDRVWGFDNLRRVHGTEAGKSTDQQSGPQTCDLGQITPLYVLQIVVYVGKLDGSSLFTNCVR